MKNFATLLFILFITISLTGCFPNSEKIIQKYDKLYEKDKEMMINHLEKKYNLEIIDAYVTRSRNGDEIIGYFFDKNDPSLGFQVMKYSDGKMKDNVDDSMHQYKARIRVYDLLEKFKPDNMLNDYLEFGADPIWGPIGGSTNGGNSWLRFAVMKDKIDINKELESDYLIVKEAMKIFKEEFPDETLGGVEVIYIEKGNFDFEKFKQESTDGRFYYESQDRSGLPSDITKYPYTIRIIDEGYKASYGSDKDYYLENEKPTEILKYRLTTENRNFDELNITSFDDYKKLALNNKEE
jgi:hypothetical protein